MTHATIGFSPRFHLDDSQNPFHSFLIFLRRKEGIQANTLCKKSVRILVKFAPFTAYRGVVSGHEGATLAARSVGKGGGGHVPGKTSGWVFNRSEIVGKCQTLRGREDLQGTTVWDKPRLSSNEIVTETEQLFLLMT